MTRYFFHFVINGTSASDTEGVELDNERAARLQAAGTLAAIFSEEVGSEGPALDASVTVRDERDAKIFEARMSYLEIESPG